MEVEAEVTVLVELGAAEVVGDTALELLAAEDELAAELEIRLEIWEEMMLEPTLA